MKNKVKESLTEEEIKKSNILLKELDELVKQGYKCLEKIKKDGFKK